MSKKIIRGFRTNMTLYSLCLIAFVAVTVALKAAPGYTFAEVKAGAQSALEALFTGGLLGKNVTTARLLTLLCGVEGVENVHLTAPAADVAVGSTELPMLGTVTISELTEA